MTRGRIRMGALVGAFAIVVAACGGAASPTPAAVASPSEQPAASPSAAPAATPTPAASLDTTPVTITVWDYYGKGTSPFAPEVLAAFQKEYPWITVNHEDVDWDSFLTKFNTAVSSGTGPDVATIDGTWYSTLASNGYLASLDEVSGGMLNGAAIADQYTPAAVDAMTFDGKLITMMFDFDVYALYYRADLFEKKGIAVPTSWDELLAASKAIAEDRNGDGKPDHFLYAVRPDDFKFSQFLFQGGGSLLSSDNTKAAFNSQAGVDALNVQKAFLDQGTGLYWSDAEADITAAIADERVAMFNDGLFYMGLMKSAAPKQSGLWKVAVAPYPKQPGSYLGGTGLSIPVTSQKQEAAWLLIQYMLRPEVQVNALYGIAGAPPATTAALASPDLNKPDPYFGGQSPFPIFLEAMKTATAFPKVGAWNDISAVLSKACVAALLGKMTPQAALDDAAAKVNKLLAK